MSIFIENFTAFVERHIYLAGINFAHNIQQVCDKGYFLYEK